MLTQGESVEAHALRERGWSVPVIARHLKRDRKTVRTYLSGQREPGRRRPAWPDRFGPFERYCRLRFGGDPYLWATTLFEEVAALGYEGACPSFTRALRKRGLRPRCDACAAAGTPPEFLRRYWAASFASNGAVRAQIKGTGKDASAVAARDAGKVPVWLSRR